MMTTAPQDEPVLVRSWPELLPLGILAEEYVLPPDFRMSAHVHDSSHGWIILDGGFEQESPAGVRWRSPGDLETYEGGHLHQLRAGDRGARCFVFEDVPASTGTGPRRHLTRAAETLRTVLDGTGAVTALPAIETLLALPQNTRREPRWLRELDAYIAARFRDSLRAGDAARHIGLDRTHLAREFRRFRGRTFADHIRMLRLDYGRELLGGGELPLPVIALEAGFADQSHFTREFARRFGVSPGRYLRDR